MTATIISAKVEIKTVDTWLDITTDTNGTIVLDTVTLPDDWIEVSRAIAMVASWTFVSDDLAPPVEADAEFNQRSIDAMRASRPRGTK